MNLKSPTCQYNIWFLAWVAVYIIVLFASVLFIKSQQPTGALLYVMAVLPALPIGGTILVFMNYIDRVDEYLRGLLVKRFITATGLTLFICSAWGFIESNANARHFSLYLVYLLFWGLFGLTRIASRQAS
ncbi:hypothetical protein [Asticcacaulis sp. EMRT-3]|uniref:hypothetical protein n=1 Tax=Asticcacaulis sp. EMRT-3 TaxID=3040349 RepID=UPI0024AF13FC|nr:hypothetical protein [Asticcacaulis sp. EMRT-3]MDI7774165.1 hypothetical protein [Asticcacaulis sp. EMRT-3]